MQELLSRSNCREGGVRRNKIILLFKILLLSKLRAKRIRKKRTILTSPHPTLPIRGGLKSNNMLFYNLSLQH